MVVSRRQSKHESRKISIVGNRSQVTSSEDCYKATTGEEIEGLMRAAVHWFLEYVDLWNCTFTFC
jgi:hypothetical protein